MKHVIIGLAFVATLLGCTKDDIDKNRIAIESNFDNGYDGWVAGFADYPTTNNDFFDIISKDSTLPAPLNTTDGAIFISGDNHSDDLFMFLKKEITALKKNTAYRAHFYVEVASNAPSNQVGVGGPPGESVYLGIGVTNVEPKPVVDGNFYRMNIEKGNQSVGGKDRKIIGNIANGTNEWKYVLLKKEGTFDFTTGDNDSVWAMVSTDSGFEATTALFYNKIRIVFEEVG